MVWWDGMLLRYLICSSLMSAGGERAGGGGTTNDPPFRLFISCCLLIRREKKSPFAWVTAAQADALAGCALEQRACTMEESRTFERGRFYIGPVSSFKSPCLAALSFLPPQNGFPRFAGSASGIYLADTISTEVPSGSEIGEAFVSRNNGVLPAPPSHTQEIALYDPFLLKSTDLRRHDELRARLNRYFLKWHPLFPFLDGAYVLQCFDNAVALSELEAMMPATLSPEGNGSAPLGGQHAFQGLKMDDALVLTAVFTSVFSIGDMDEPSGSGSGNIGEGRRPLPLFRSTKQVTTLANLIVGCCQDSSVNDMFALQALASLELRLYATRSFRPAMHLSGTVASESSYAFPVRGYPYLRWRSQSLTLAQNSPMKPACIDVLSVTRRHSAQLQTEICVSGCSTRCTFWIDSSPPSSAYRSC
jgi:hypothetical protein